MSDPPCPFCTIISGHDPNAKVVYQDTQVTAFFPLKPATRGHTMVVPSRHVSDLTDLTDAESRNLGAAIRRTAKAVRASVSPDGMNVIQSTGTAATQTVPHVHFHIVPRWNKDPMELNWPDSPAESEAAQLTLSNSYARSCRPRPTGFRLRIDANTCPSSRPS